MFETLSLLVHGDSKVGKSSLGATCPPPILILDAEGSTKFLPVRKIEWRPEQGPPPAYDGTWDACIVVVRDFNTMLMAGQWLLSGQHQFRSVVLDSISEIQRKLKKQVGGGDSNLGMQGWGELLTKMDDLIRNVYRDLTLHPTNPVQVVMFVAETREKNGKMRPYMQGQIEISLPYWVDVVGFLHVADVPTADGVGTTAQRQLITVPNQLYEAGERVQGRLPGVIAEPHVTGMLYAIFPNLIPTQADPTPQEAAQ